MTTNKKQKKGNILSFFIVHFSLLLLFSAVTYADFTKTGDVVTDSETQLQWKDDAVGGTMTWTAAISHCENLTFATHSDWRLPNLKELTSLVDDSQESPSIDISTFEYTTSNFYWSSTTSASQIVFAWGVNFNNGGQYISNKSNSHHYVRCIRAGQ